MPTEAEVLTALSQIQDPDLHRDIVSLGMIKDLRIGDDGVVAFTFELTTPACPVRDQFQTLARQYAGALPGVTDVRVKMTANVRPSFMQRDNSQLIPGVKQTIAVASGKGGVGKSTVAVNIATALAQAGAAVGLLDTDVYGPSIPLMMGVHDKPLMRNNKIVPLEAHGVTLMSIGFLLDPDKALIWRGPLVAQLITQFLNDVDWGNLDYLVIDLPPGTGDVQLTLVQKIPISGAVIVTTPQEVALVDAVKGLKMFQEVKTPILGIIENMSGFVCPGCGEVHDIFGSGGGKRTAERHGVELLGQIPIETRVREGGDEGVPVVAAAPDSLTGRAFRHAAGRVAGRLSVEAANKPRKPTIMLKTVR